MMHVNFNRSVNFLLISISLIVAGCSETQKAPVSVNDQLPEYDQDIYYATHPRPKLTFGNQKHKSASTQHDTVWDRLLSLYSLPEIDNERIDRAISWYLQHPASLAIIQQRAEPYLHHILDEVEAKNIPGELALLPVVESAFIPNAYSHADASGLWQFIPSTGEEYGLQQNAWYDGRRDVYASTKAATSYLKELSENFDGDWLLALASYNCGKNRVKKSIEKNEYRNLPTDYWSLDLPGETEDYVPKLLAIAKIFANAEQYNIHLQHIPNKPYFEVVDIKAPLDLRKAAQLANTPFDKFIKLNPGFNRSCTAPQGPHRLLVPVEQAQSFKKNLAMLPFDERVNLDIFNEDRVAAVKHDELKLAQLRQNDERDSQVRRDMTESDERISQVRHEPAKPVKSRHDDEKILQARHEVEKAVKTRHEEAPVVISTKYKVKAGENLASIASRNHTTIKSIREANHLTGSTVRSGMFLQIPSKATNKHDSNLLLAKASKIKTVNSQIYAVKKGDTFWNISQRFSVSPKELAEWNKITLKTALVPGRKLTIKSMNQQLASSSSAVRLIRYTVGKGDSLTQIARKFNVSIADLRKSNADTLSRGLQSGQKLKILVDGQPST